MNADSMLDVETKIVHHVIIEFYLYGRKYEEH